MVIHKCTYITQCLKKTEKSTKSLKNGCRIFKCIECPEHKSKFLNNVLSLEYEHVKYMA